MASTRIYKYVSKTEHLENFLQGLLYCSSLQHFLRIEHDGVQGDAFEGIASYAPVGGLQINKLSPQRSSFTLQGHRLESSLERKEIYICCFSTLLSEKIAQRFKSIACVEVLDVPKFCNLASLALPGNLMVPKISSSPRIGYRVRYYDHTDPPANLWACPDLISISKQKGFSWQQEFRLVFGAEGSFDFESADYRIISRPKPLYKNTASRPAVILEVGNVSAICKVHHFDKMQLTPPAA
jgi:hypothetical protein